MKNNIITGKTLKQYEDKYKGYKLHLLSFSKKEVEDLDKQAGIVGDNACLKHRKWWLIGDRYYEIPKPIRWTWFKGLSGSAKFATCLLTVGVVGGAATGTYFVVNHFLGGPTIIINPDKSDIATITYKIDPKTGDAIVDVNAKEGKTMTGVEVKIGDKLLTENTDYNVEEASNSVTKYVVTIFKKTLEAYKGKIVITPLTKEPEEPFDGVVTRDEWEKTLTYLVECKSTRKYKCIKTVNDNEDYIIELDGDKLKYKDNSMNEETYQYSFNDAYAGFNYQDPSYIGSCGLNNNDGLIKQIYEDVYQHLLNKFTEYTFDETTKSYIKTDTRLENTKYTVKFCKINTEIYLNSFEVYTPGGSKTREQTTKYSFSNLGTHSIDGFPQDINNYKNVTKEGSSTKYNSELYEFYNTEINKPYCFYHFELPKELDNTKYIVFKLETSSGQSVKAYYNYGSCVISNFQYIDISSKDEFETIYFPASSLGDAREISFFVSTENYKGESGSYLKLVVEYDCEEPQA